MFLTLPFYLLNTVSKRDKPMITLLLMTAEAIPNPITAVKTALQNKKMIIGQLELDIKFHIKDNLANLKEMQLENKKTPEMKERGRKIVERAKGYMIRDGYKNVSPDVKEKLKNFIKEVEKACDLDWVMVE